MFLQAVPFLNFIYVESDSDAKCFTHRLNNDKLFIIIKSMVSPLAKWYVWPILQ